MFSNRRPYYGLKASIADFFREPVRYLKTSNTQESMSEKPYLIDEYPKMHLSLHGFNYKPKKRPGFFGDIASGTPYGGLASISYGESRCQWRVVNTGWCTSEPLIITMWADYFWRAEFKFVAEIVEDTIGVMLEQLPETESVAWDDQDYKLTFPENANGTVTICGFASANVLISDTFENITAGMPVGMYKFGGQQNPAVSQKSFYGDRGANCGCITIETSCDPCIDAVAIAWDDDASAETVARNNSVSVAIKDGLGPYNWSVTGTGFTVGSAQTSGVSNTVIADGSACGSATITVIDQCGLATGYVRCTTGVWVTKNTLSEAISGGCDAGNLSSVIANCCPSGCSVSCQWGSIVSSTNFFDPTHRVVARTGSWGDWGGTTVSGGSGCSLIGTMGWGDGYEQTYLKIAGMAVDTSSCNPAGCINGFFDLQLWECA